MPSLRQYRDRISSVKSTRKITSAMKMVAASKLKRAQDQAQASQPYAAAMARMLARVAANLQLGAHSPKLMVGTGEARRHLLVIISSDRGLCGGFNTNIIRNARQQIEQLIEEGKEVQLITIGRKVYEALRRQYGGMILRSYTGIGSSGKITIEEVDEVMELVFERFEADTYDICSLLYNQFQSVLTQKPSMQQIIPFRLTHMAPMESNDNFKPVKTQDGSFFESPYTFEPDEKTLLEKLLPRNIRVQLHRALLDSAAGEQAARMTAMDNATRNAGDLIKDLTLEYNRARQAYITKELIEIISGAEAV